MRVEIAIATGDPQAPGGWSVGPTVFLAVFPFENRQRIFWLFDFLRGLSFAEDDILVFMVDANMTALLIDRVRDIRNLLLGPRRICLLDNGLKLSDLTPAQIRARVG
jgi:hypothetical protein